MTTNALSFKHIIGKAANFCLFEHGISITHIRQSQSHTKNSLKIDFVLYELRAKIDKVERFRTLALLVILISWVIFPPGGNSVPDGDNIWSVKLLGTAT